MLFSLKIVSLGFTYVLKNTNRTIRFTFVLLQIYQDFYMTFKSWSSKHVIGDEPSGTETLDILKVVLPRSWIFWARLPSLDTNHKTYRSCLEPIGNLDFRILWDSEQICRESPMALRADGDGASISLRVIRQSRLEMAQTNKTSWACEFSLGERGIKPKNVIFGTDFPWNMPKWIRIPAREPQRDICPWDLDSLRPFYNPFPNGRSWSCLRHC